NFFLLSTISPYLLSDGEYSANERCTFITNSRYADAFDDYIHKGIWIAVDKDNDGTLEGYFYDRQMSYPAQFLTFEKVNCKEKSLITTTPDGLRVVRLESWSKYIGLCSPPKITNITTTINGVTTSKITEGKSKLAYFYSIDEPRTISNQYIDVNKEDIIISCILCSEGQEKCDGSILIRCVNNGFRSFGEIEGKCGYTIVPELIREINSLGLSVLQASDKIKELSLTLDDQTEVIDGLTFSIAEKAQLIEDLTGSIEEQAQI
ncbi:unnamed protein product, partial [marine sediment metagenome]